MIRPTQNTLSRGYSSSHRGYDFRGLNLPDEVKVGASGIIIQRVDQYVNNWSNTGNLTTRDYGNYIKIRHNDGSFELHAHLKKGSALNKGEVKAGQVCARIGNTGNSTGPHLHSEYRNSNNQNIQVEFKEENMNPDWLIRNSDAWIGILTFLGITKKDPTLDDAKNVVAGYKARATAMEKEKGQWEAKYNAEKEVSSNLNTQLTKAQKDLKDSNTKLNESDKNLNEANGKVSAMIDDKKIIAIELSECKAKREYNIKARIKDWFLGRYK